MTNIGFVYLKNHGIDKATVSDYRLESSLVQTNQKVTQTEPVEISLVVQIITQELKVNPVSDLFVNFQIDAVLKASSAFFVLPDDSKFVYQRDATHYEGYSGVDQEM